VNLYFQVTSILALLLCYFLTYIKLNKMKNTKNIFIGFMLVFVLVVATFLTWIYSAIESALPILDGKKTLFGLSATTIVERDTQGIATIKAKSRQDIAIATGFIHAQERFFQMDLLRRNAAGELSSLFGGGALDYDKTIRTHRFRARARAIVNQLPDKQLSLLKAYTRGVNQGLNSLNASPFEYIFLQQDPVEWQEEDTILSVFSMYIDLQYNQGERERTLGAIQALYGDAVLAFLNPKGSMWDAAIDNTTYLPSPMPILSWLTSSTKPTNVNQLTQSKPLTSSYKNEPLTGSNSWAISGNISQTGSAIIANDMHLAIRVPNTWFRASFEYLNSTNKPIKVTGLTLPGTPNMIIGSNSNIAWGFTNSFGDWSDVIVLDMTKDNSKYLTPNGYKPFTESKQIIAIKGQDAIEITIKETIWGPVIDTGKDGPLLAYRWVAHDKQAVNLYSSNLEMATSVDEAFIIAAKSGIPAQNIVVGDKEGNIGWTVMGAIPKKNGIIGNTPKRWADGKNGWQGYLSPKEYPKVKNPSQQRIWTANSRVIGDSAFQLLGNGGYALGARSQQIKKRLFAKSSFNENDLLAIALDDEGLFLRRWQDFLLEKVLTSSARLQTPQWQDIYNIVDTEQLSASTDSVSYRLIRNYRLNLRNSVFEHFNKSLKAFDESYDFHTIRHQIETPLWQLINEQPSNVIGFNKVDWQLLFERALNKTITEMSSEQTLTTATWGKQNTSKIQHPLSKGIPFIGRWLDMPRTELAGDDYMPRVQGSSFGASQRMIVSPGHENRGIMHMPTSQAGHPWSPYYQLGHKDWEQGKASPFLPGDTKYTLTLIND